MKKNIKVLIEKVVLILLLVVVLLLAVNLRKADNAAKELNENELIINKVVDISGKTIEGVRDILGKEKSIHKDKVYTYEDSVAKYDLLVVDDVESMIISFKKAKSKEEVYKLLAIKGDMMHEKSLKSEEHYKIIDKENNLECNLIVDKNDEVKSVKVIYR